MIAEAVEYTDPGCPWSWGSEPNLRWLRRRYAGEVGWRRVFGVQLDGIAGADAEEPAADVHARWLEMARYTGVPLTDRLERAHASTRPAALAAKAAERQGPAAADAVLRALREAFFVAGRPPDTAARIYCALSSTPGVDVDQLLADTERADVRAALDADWREARAPHPSVLGLGEPGPHPGGAKREPAGATRYAFPTVIVRGSGGEQVIPGWRPPDVYRAAFESAAPELRGVCGRAAPEPAAASR